MACGQRSERVSGVMVHGALCIDLINAKAMWNGTRLVLAPLGVATLARLAAKPGVIVSRDEFIGVDDQETFDRAIDTRIRNIRRALRGAGAPEIVETVYKRGYRLAANVIGDPESIVRGRLEINARRGLCRWKGRHVHLTQSQLGIVALLVARPGVMRSYSELAQSVGLMDSYQAMNTAVRKIRAAFRLVDPDSNPIRSRYGLGVLLHESIADGLGDVSRSSKAGDAAHVMVSS